MEFSTSAWDFREGHAPPCWIFPNTVFSFSVWLLNEAKLRFSVEYNNSIGAFLVGTYCAMSFPYSKKNRKGYVAFLFLFFLFLFYRYFTSVAMTAPSVAVMEPRLMISLKVIRLRSFFIGTMISHPGKMSFADFTLVTVPFI